MDRLNYPPAHVHACWNQDCQVDMGYCHCGISDTFAFLCSECEEKQAYLEIEKDEEDKDAD